MTRTSASPPPGAPPDATLLIGIAMQALRQGDADGATHWCRQLLQHHPTHAEAHTLLGVIAARSGDFNAAVGAFTRSLELLPAQPAVQNNCGVALRRLGRAAEAQARFRQAIALKPDYAEAHFNLANLLRDERQPQQALASYEQALACQPTLAAAHNGRGAALADLGQPAHALECFDRALVLQPGLADGHANRAQALFALERLEESLAAAEAALALQPEHPGGWVHRGNAQARLRRHAEALASYERALALAPQDAMALASRGAALIELHRCDEAMASLQQALALAPDDRDALDNLAQAAGKTKRHDEAAAAYERLLALDPAWPAVAGNLLHARMLGCDWRDFDPLARQVQEGLRAGRLTAEPFGLQGFCADEADLRLCAERYAEREYPPRPLPPASQASARDDRITVAYVCGEFRQHATTMLMCGVFEHHAPRFRRIAFDNGGSDGSAYRQRLEQAFDEIIDIRGLSDRDAALLARERGVDILVNLNGYYGDGRMGLFAHRPCAVQVNYLGFPGTLGADYFDYLIADEVVIPAASRGHYREQIVWLPGCYQANDDRRPIDADPPPRSAHGLPETGIVFCCFNNNYKLTPVTFDAWMRILQQVPGSVLWLLEDTPVVPPRLRAEAESRGVAGERLVFAPRLPPAQHLARHAAADLFLDTLPYNAHTTASDALWAGLPVLTQRGTAFAGRVAASLLRAVGLPELVTENAAAYVARAVALAQSPGELAGLRTRLANNLATSPLFDTARFTRQLEAAFERMMERHAQGLPAAAFRIEDDPGG